MGDYVAETQSTQRETPREEIAQASARESRPSPDDLENDFDLLPDAKDVIEIEVDQSKKEYEPR